MWWVLELKNHLQRLVVIVLSFTLFSDIHWMQEFFPPVFKKKIQIVFCCIGLSTYYKWDIPCINPQICVHIYLSMVIIRYSNIMSISVIVWPDCALQYVHCTLYVFPELFQWHDSPHSRRHWLDLLEMNGLITGGERSWKAARCGDGWNWGLELRKPLRQIEGINDCCTARGASVAHPSPWYHDRVMVFIAVPWDTGWARGADRMSSCTPLGPYKVSQRPLSGSKGTTCPTHCTLDDGPRPPRELVQAGWKHSLDYCFDKGSWYWVTRGDTVLHSRYCISNDTVRIVCVDNLFFPHKIIFAWD